MSLTTCDHPSNSSCSGGAPHRSATSSDRPNEVEGRQAHVRPIKRVRRPSQTRLIDQTGLVAGSGGKHRGDDATKLMAGKNGIPTRDTLKRWRKIDRDFSGSVRSAGESSQRVEFRVEYPETAAAQALLRRARLTMTRIYVRQFAATRWGSRCRRQRHHPNRGGRPLPRPCFRPGQSAWTGSNMVGAR